jgi:hypothetical protein
MNSTRVLRMFDRWVNTLAGSMLCVEIAERHYFEQVMHEWNENVKKIVEDAIYSAYIEKVKEALCKGIPGLSEEQKTALVVNAIQDMSIFECPGEDIVRTGIRTCMHSLPQVLATRQERQEKSKKQKH